MDVINNLLKIDTKNNMGITGITDEFFCVYLVNLLNQKKQNILVVVNSLYEANKLYSSIQNYTDSCYLFPMDDFLTSEALVISPDLEFNRLETINNIISGNGNIVITNLMGYLRYLPTKKNYQQFFVDIKLNEEINPQKLVEKLVSSGYVRDSIVDKTGEFAVRGFIIDVFPIGEDNPVRIEFFGDFIDSIRYFDVNSQKSLSSINNILIKPCTEFLSIKTVNESHFKKQKYLPYYETVTNLSLIHI